MQRHLVVEFPLERLIEKPLPIEFVVGAIANCWSHCTDFLLLINIH